MHRVLKQCQELKNNFYRTSLEARHCYHNSVRHTSDSHVNDNNNLQHDNNDVISLYLKF